MSLEKHEQAKQPFDILNNAFEYCGYHFTPYRAFYAGETDRPLEGDSRPWKKDAAYAFRNMKSDFELGLSKYEGKKAGRDYSHKGFYAASGNSTADIFRCIENGRLYVPCENELCQYTEPPYQELAAFGGCKQDLEKSGHVKWLLEVMTNAVTSYENDANKIYFDYDSVIGLLEQVQIHLTDSVRCTRPADLPEHLPWCEKMYNGDDVFNPYAYADMSHEDYEKMRELMEESEESEDMEI